MRVSSMSPAAQTVESALSEVLNRLGRVETELSLLRRALGDLAAQSEHAPSGGVEIPVEGWSHLVLRPHPRRRQLALKGRNLTVGQFASTVRANRLTPVQAAEAFDLTPEAVREALAYAEQNRALLEWETAEERRRLTQKGHRLEPAHLPR
jgi:hypothetical protein